jgi:hypothetical protein
MTVLINFPRLFLSLASCLTMLLVTRSVSAATLPVTADLRFWVSADAIDANNSKQVRLVGGNTYLQDWVDQSGNGVGATQNVAAAQPQYVADALNAKPVIRFSGAQYLSTALPQIAGDKTIFVVQRRTSATVGTEITGTASTGHFLGNNGTSETKGRLGVAHDLSLTGSLNKAIVKSYIRAGSLENLQVNYASVSSSSIPDVANGFYRISGTTYSFIGDIAEIVIYDRALSESERLAVVYYLLLKWVTGAFGSSDIRSVAQDIQPPPMVTDSPAPGKRVKQTSPEYSGTDVYHTLYLPTNWQAGHKYPVIVDYAGNYDLPPAPAIPCTGKVEDIALGYGLTGGVNYIWICMPTIGGSPQANQETWWGDINATKQYCMTTINHVCQDYGGDPSAIICSGFSRGSIGCNYIGLGDDSIADVWLGFICHAHYDGQITTWGYPNDDAASAYTRLLRLHGRSQHLSQETTLTSAQGYLLGTGVSMAPFTFSQLPFTNHEDIWALRPIQLRTDTRTWLQSVVQNRPGTHSISGRVANSGGYAISGATVQSGTTHFATTDTNGNYVLAGLIDSSRTVSATAAGYAFNPIPVTLSGSNLTNINFIGSGTGAVIVDNNNANNSGGSLSSKTGAWTSSTSVAGFYGANYEHDGNTGKGTKTFTFTPNLTASGSYKVYLRWTTGPTRATSVPVDVYYAGGTDLLQVNQQSSNNTWVLLGVYPFNTGTGQKIVISNTGTNGYVIADAVMFAK